MLKQEYDNTVKICALCKMDQRLKTILVCSLLLEACDKYMIINFYITLASYKMNCY